MSNHVKNYVTMREISTLPVYTEDKNGDLHFDFNKVRPMPDSLDISAGGDEDLAIRRMVIKIMEYLADNTLCFHQYRDELSSMCSNICSMYPNTLDSRDDEHLDQIGMQYIENIINHGASSWYRWCVNNWGTKWNAYDTKILDNNNVRFTTAWRAPEPIYKAISQAYSYDKIKVYWESEGGTCGITSYLDGDCIENKEYISVTSEDDVDYDKPRLFTKVEPIR